MERLSRSCQDLTKRSMHHVFPCVLVSLPCVSMFFQDLGKATKIRVTGRRAGNCLLSRIAHPSSKSDEELMLPDRCCLDMGAGPRTRCTQNDCPTNYCAALPPVPDSPLSPHLQDPIWRLHSLRSLISNDHGYCDIAVPRVEFSWSRNLQRWSEEERSVSGSHGTGYTALWPRESVAAYRL